MNANAFDLFVLRHRWLIVIASLLVTALFGYQFKYMKTTDDMKVFFKNDNPQVIALEKFKNTYGETQNAYIAIAPNDKNIYTREHLALLEEFTAKAWQIPYSSRVDSLQNFQRTRVDGDQLTVANAFDDAKNLSDDSIAELRNYASNHSVLADLLVARDGAIASVVINLNIRDGEGAHEKREEVMNSIDKMLAEMNQKYPDVTFYKTGGVYVNKAFNEAMLKDAFALLPLMVGLMIVFMVIFLRSFAAMLGTLLVVICSVIMAVGGAVISGITMTNVTAMAPIVILTVGVADSIHIIISMFHMMAHGKSKDEAILETMRINHMPVFLTSFTTVIGFLSLNTNESPPFRDMGNEVSIGVVAAYLMSVFFLPAFLSLVPMKARKMMDEDTPALERFGMFVTQNYKVVFAVALAVIAAVSSQIPRLEFNDMFLEYFDKTIEFRRTNDFLVEHMVGLVAYDYDIDSGEEGGINKPDYLRDLAKFREWLLTQPKVQYVGSYDNIVFEINKTMHGDEDAYYRAPETRELASQYLLMYEMSLPMGREISNSISDDRRRTRLTLFLENSKTSEIIGLTEKAEQWAKDNAPNIQVSPGIGETVMFAHIAKRNIVSTINGSFVALFLISALLIFTLRSFKLGMLSLIPDILPLLMAFGAWAILVGELGMSGGCVLVISLGIIVDNTIHFFSKYLTAKREMNKNTEEAIHYAFRTVGLALLVTSAILVLGFSMLYGSAFKPTKDMGLLVSLTVGFALIATYFVIPPLLMIFDADKQKNEAEAPASCDA